MFACCQVEARPRVCPGSCPLKVECFSRPYGHQVGYPCDFFLCHPSCPAAWSQSAGTKSASQTASTAADALPVPESVPETLPELASPLPDMKELLFTAGTRIFLTGGYRLLIQPPQGRWGWIRHLCSLAPWRFRSPVLRWFLSPRRFLLPWFLSTRWYLPTRWFLFPRRSLFPQFLFLFCPSLQFS